MAFQSLFSTTLAARAAASDTTLTLATVPTITAGRVRIFNSTVSELCSFTGVSGSTLTGVGRNLSKTASPATVGGTGYVWPAGTKLEIVLMHDQIVDNSFPSAPTYADDAAADAAWGGSAPNGAYFYSTAAGSMRYKESGVWTGGPGSTDWAQTRSVTIASAATGEFTRASDSSNDLHFKDNGGVDRKILVAATGKFDTNRYDFASQAEAEAGTEATKPMTAQRTQQAIAALGGINLTVGENVAALDMLYVNPALPEVSKQSADVTSAGLGQTATGKMYSERVSNDVFVTVSTPNSITADYPVFRSYSVSGTSISQSTERRAGLTIGDYEPQVAVGPDGTCVAIVIKTSTNGSSLASADCSGTTLSTIDNTILQNTVAETNGGVANIGLGKYFAVTADAGVSRAVNLYTVTGSGRTLTLAGTNAIATLQASNVRCFRIADDIGLVVYVRSGATYARAIAWSGTTPTIGGESSSLSGTSIAVAYLPTSATTGYVLYQNGTSNKLTRSGTSLTIAGGFTSYPPTSETISTAHGYSDGTSKAKIMYTTGTSEAYLVNLRFSGTDLVQENVVGLTPLTPPNVNGASLRFAYVSEDRFAGATGTTTSMAIKQQALWRTGMAKAAATTGNQVNVMDNAIVGTFTGLIPGCRYDVTVTPPTLAANKAEGRGSGMAVSSTKMLIY